MRESRLRKVPSEAARIFRAAFETEKRGFKAFLTSEPSADRTPLLCRWTDVRETYSILAQGSRQRRDSIRLVVARRESGRKACM
jgi:hypothetical protein